jgi:hypothetical protein
LLYPTTRPIAKGDRFWVYKMPDALIHVDRRTGQMTRLAKLGDLQSDGTFGFESRRLTGRTEMTMVAADEERLYVLLDCIWWDFGTANAGQPQVHQPPTSQPAGGPILLLLPIQSARSITLRVFWLADTSSPIDEATTPPANLLTVVPGGVEVGGMIYRYDGRKPLDRVPATHPATRPTQ